MRRGVGIGAIKKKQDHEAKFKEKGSELASEQLRLLSRQLDSFRSNLEEFAAKYRQEIRKNSEFRRQFQEMCAQIGVDPLASSKGFWAETLGVGEFYYELAVQIVEVCLATNHLNGGIMTLDELRERLLKSRSKMRKDHISNDDLLRAIGKIKVLGAGFTVMPLGEGRFLVQSIPGELSMDQSRVLQSAEETGCMTVAKLCGAQKWEEERAKRVLEQMVQTGLAWVDNQASNREISYWFPGLFSQIVSSDK